MIDPHKPDYENTPADNRRAVFGYRRQSKANDDYSNLLVSIITPYFNTGEVFWETVTSLKRMSFVDWEWIIVDDGSTSPNSLVQLETLLTVEPRARVIHQKNGGPSVARNRAAHEARGEYLFIIDSDDTVEPTFLEKCLWVLETQPQFAFCGSWVVGHGIQTYLWSKGFEQQNKFLQENFAIVTSVIRKQAHVAVGGFDEHVSYGHADWDYWLSLANMAYWGFTIPEYLSWYRRQDKSLFSEVETNYEKINSFKNILNLKHLRLLEHFPSPRWVSSADIPYDEIKMQIPFLNPLDKPTDTKRILLIIPFLDIGGSDKFNLDMIKELTKLNFQFTIATTVANNHLWFAKFTDLTPDVFCLEHFLHYSDYPRFLSYLIYSRQIDYVCVSNSTVGYGLIPYLRGQHPTLTFIDYNHMEQEEWNNGGHPGMGVRVQPLLDLSIVATDHLKQWMVSRGADANRIRVVHCNVDTTFWTPNAIQRTKVRAELSMADDIPLILFVGRVHPQKRPLLFVEILHQLAELGITFKALVIGDGIELPTMKQLVQTKNMGDLVTFCGALDNVQVKRWMYAGDILLLPSDYEGLALVIYEAMAMGIVPIGADVGGQKELVTTECGFLIPKGSQELEQYVDIIKTLASNPLVLRQMGEQSHIRVQTYFTLSNMANNMVDALNEAESFAKTQPRSTVAPDLGRFIGHQIIELKRVAEVADSLWTASNMKTSSLANMKSLYDQSQQELNSIKSTRFWRMANRWWRVKRQFRMIFKLRKLYSDA